MIDVGIIAQTWEDGRGHGTLARNLPLLLPLAKRNGLNIKIFNLHPLVSLKKIIEKDIVGFASMWIPLYSNLPELKILHAVESGVSIPGTEIVTLHDVAPLKFPEIYLKNIFTKLGWDYRKFILKNANIIVAISNFSKNEAERILGISSKRIKVIYQGIDHRAFFVDKKHSRWHRQGKINIVSAANNDPRKNFPLLIEAVGILQEMGKEVNAVRFGLSEWVEEGKKMRKLAEQWKVRVVEPGVVPIEELRKAYSTFDVFVWPSIYEGFGYPPLEAMACGCKVVALDTEFNREFLGDVPVYVKNDPKDMAEGILEALKMDIGQRGIEQAKKFTWEKWAEEHINLYKSTLEAL